jgi:uncharacterized protein DUF6458
MTIGGSIFIIAIGAILRYAVDFDVKGVDINTIGLILMIAGIAALLISLIYTFWWSRESRRTYAARDPYYNAPPPAGPDDPTRPL